MSIVPDELWVSLKKMSEFSKIPVSIVDIDGRTLINCPSVGRKDASSKFVKQFIDEYLDKGFEEDFPSMVTKQLDFMVGVLKLPENLYLIIGPISSRKITLEEITEVYNDKISPYELLHFYKIINYSNPTDPVRFANLLAGITFNIHHRNILPLDIIQRNYQVQPSDYYNAAQNDGSLVGSGKIRFGYDDNILSDYSQLLILQFEENIFSAIFHGKIADLAEIWKTPFPFTIGGKEASDYERHCYSITFMALCNRAAVRGGTDTTIAYKMLIEQIMEIKELSNYAEHLAYAIKMSYDYCNIVRKYSGADTMPAVCLECEKYIAEHLSEKITADNLARYCGVSRRKLYSVFESNFEMTITEYIQQERIRKAKTLLDTTTYTMAEISSLTGFANQSYFISVFSKHCGCTPAQFKTRATKDRL